MGAASNHVHLLLACEMHLSGASVIRAQMTGKSLQAEIEQT
ncbi:MAG: REP element-mobilizing transposase RayT, partial [Pirellulaceae bacterium]